MNDDILPEPEDYRAEIDRMLLETRQTIQVALGYIEQQEDGPLTMRFALGDIDKSVSAIESEVWYLSSALDRLQALAAKLMDQRNEAVRQRDLLIGFFGSRK